MSAGIYQIQHIESGRRYIGSSVNVNLRLRKHREQLRRGDHVNPALQNGWASHGEDAFEFRQILVCRPDDMIMYENLIIDGYRANVKPHGYNSRVAAESNRGMESPKMAHKPGDRYGRLTLLEITARSQSGIRARYACDCGEKTEANANAVKQGLIRSCGCIKAEMLRTNRARKVGDKFNRFTLISLAVPDPNGRVNWLCRCDCGTEKVMNVTLVAKGQIKSCGCLKAEAAQARSPRHAGEKFNRLTLVELSGRNAQGIPLWRCACDCGGEVFASGARVAGGKVKSCGCYRREHSGAKMVAYHAAKRVVVGQGALGALMEAGDG